MWEITHYHRALRPHAKEMLEGLKGLGMKLGVISNTASLYQVFDILEEYGIRDYFQDVTLSSVTGYRKPDPNIFQVSLRQVQSRPEHCAYVGDTISRDVIGPIRMGFGATFHIDSYLTRLKDTDVPRTFTPPTACRISMRCILSCGTPADFARPSHGEPSSDCPCGSQRPESRLRKP